MQGAPSSTGDDGRCKLQLKAYAKVDAEPPENMHGCIPVMVSITAPSVMAEQREPVDIVIVLHVRVGCKVPGNWQDLLMKAVQVVTEKLRDEDRLAVIPSGGTTRVSEDPGQRRKVKYTESLLPMSDKNKKSYSDALKEAIQKCDNPLVRALETADSILYGQSYENAEDRRAGYIIVISNSAEDMGSLLTWRFRSVLAFGFRDAHNARTMHTIARSRDSTYAILDDEHGGVSQAFASSVDRITSAVAAMPVEVRLRCCEQKEVTLSGVDAPHISYFISYDKKEIWASTYLCGLVTNFIVYLSLGDLRDQLVQKNDLRDQITVLRVKHRRDKLDGKVLTVNNGIDGSREVAAEIVRIKAVKIVAEFTCKEDKNDSEELHKASNEMGTRWTDLYRDREATEAGDLISGLPAEMKEMEIRLYNNYLWLEYMLSWNSHQWWQLPLPRLFMDKQDLVVAVVDPERETNVDPLVRLTILAKVDTVSGTTNVTESQQQQQPQKQQQQQDTVTGTVTESQQQREPQKQQQQQQDNVTGSVTKSQQEPQKQQQQQQQQCLPVLVRIVAPETGLAKAKRAPVDLVVVMDASRGATEMEKKAKRRMEQLTEAMELIIAKLSHKDRLAIVPVDDVQSPSSSSREHASLLLLMSKHGKIKVRSLVNQVVSKSPLAPAHNKTDLPHMQTIHWREKLNKAMELIKKCLHIAPVNLTSDPAPTTPSESQSRSSRTTQTSVPGQHRLSTQGGPQSTILWNALSNAIQTLERPEETNQDGRPGFIIVISNSVDNISMTLQKTLMKSKQTVHAFSFHNSDERNTRAMHNIASGIYGSLHDTPNQISQAFTVCINKITSTIGVETKVDVAYKCSHPSSITLSKIQCGKLESSIGEDKKSVTISAGTLHAGTVKNFMLYFDNVREEDHGDFSKMLEVHVSWRKAFDRSKEKLKGQVAIVKKEDAGYMEVMAEIARVEAGKIVGEITDPGYNKFGRTLSKCVKAEEEAQAAGDASLAREMEMMKNLMLKVKEKNTTSMSMETVDPGTYARKLLADKLSYMLSWLSFQDLSEQAPWLS